MKKYMGFLVFVVMVSLMAGCGLVGQNSGTAKLVVKLTDAPAENIEQVLVTITKVEIEKEATDTEEGGLVTLNDLTAEPLKVDLLTLRFSEELLGSKDIAVGKYTRIWITVDQTNGANKVVFTDGTEQNLKVPANGHLKIDLTRNEAQGLVIEKGMVREIVLDADVRDFIHQRGQEKNGYIINPNAVRVIDKKVSSDIFGRVLNGADSLPISGININVELYTASHELVVGTIALSEDLKDESGNVIHPAGSFVLKGVLAGDYYLKVTVEGFVEFTTPVFPIEQDQDVTLEDILLSAVQG